MQAKSAAPKKKRTHSQEDFELTALNACVRVCTYVQSNVTIAFFYAAH